MKYLLDISTLIAAIWNSHEAHGKVTSWMNGKTLAVCPLTELGFLRISTHPKGPFQSPMTDARALLADFLQKNRCEFVPADLPALKSSATSSAVVTDSYLADLADAHELHLATLDTRIKHKAVTLIA